MIEKYLEPLDANKEKEKKQATGLKDLRNKMVFSLFMLNAVFVIVAYLMQVCMLLSSSVQTFFSSRSFL